jgi:hypothetical protein
VDAPQGKAFFAVPDAIQAFDVTSFAPLAAIPVPGINVNTGVSSMIRWGSNGLALVTQSNTGMNKGILLIDGTLVKP